MHMYMGTYTPCDSLQGLILNDIFTFHVQVAATSQHHTAVASPKKYEAVALRSNQAAVASSTKNEAVVAQKSQAAVLSSSSVTLPLHMTAAISALMLLEGQNTRMSAAWAAHTYTDAVVLVHENPEAFLAGMQSFETGAKTALQKKLAEDKV